MASKGVLPTMQNTLTSLFFCCPQIDTYIFSVTRFSSIQFDLAVGLPLFVYLFTFESPPSFLLMLFLSGGANGQIEWNGILNQNQIQILIPNQNAGPVH